MVRRLHFSKLYQRDSKTPNIGLYKEKDARLNVRPSKTAAKSSGVLRISIFTLNFHPSSSPNQYWLLGEVYAVMEQQYAKCFTNETAVLEINGRSLL